MKTRLQRILLASICIICFATCKKSIDHNGSDPEQGISNQTTEGIIRIDTTVAYPEHRLSNCPNAPDYGDSIFFLQPSSVDYVISPKNHPLPGTYFSWPGGMVIDKFTGNINISKSEIGLRYNIGYVQNGTTDTCVQALILAGASYTDGVYVLSNNERYAAPYFNADPNLTNVCGNGGPGNKSCEFDVSDKLSKKNIKIDKKTGVIDLKNTLKSAFGPLPVNGASVTITMSYTLNDKSNMAMEQIPLQFIYYNTKADVPPALLATVTDKANKIQNGNLLVNVPGTTPQLKNGNPRPPIIIVTRAAF